MSIPVTIDPLGTLGGDWKEVDMSSFKRSNWDDLAAMSPPGLVPCGLPNGLIFNVKQCTRSNAEEMLYFGYDNKCTTYKAAYSYTNRTVPPRNKTSAFGAPVLEFWSLSRPMFFRLEFTLDVNPTKVWATRNDWDNTVDYAQIPVTSKDGTYIVETPFEAKSIIILCQNGSRTGDITKIYKK